MNTKDRNFLFKKHKMVQYFFGTLFGVLSLLFFFWDKIIDNNDKDNYRTETDSKFDTISSKTDIVEKNVEELDVKVDSSLTEITVEQDKASLEREENKKRTLKTFSDVQSIKVTAEKTNFNTASARFFQENENNFEKYKVFFENGFTVYHHSPDFEKPFKKGYGSDKFVEYLD